ncbi:hypothetical protein GOBAR_AA07896 [Gossypium barbadense]|uniref:Uncharacterized protein n=1 Tax=Gossypium barbadense TaxID=3634 RepID=A0A2P5YAY4_GOSBA|nr:hypothetical protein GOBAR_AA07896 [Gossypium barbadense]
MELVDDEDMETMIALYCGNRSAKNALIHLFAELTGMEQNEDLTAYGEEHRAQEPCIVLQYRTLIVNRFSDPCNQEVDSDSDPNVDEVPDDIDDKNVNGDGNINASLVKSQIRCIVIHNNPGHTCRS